MPDNRSSRAAYYTQWRRRNGIKPRQPPRRVPSGSSEARRRHYRSPATYGPFLDCDRCVAATIAGYLSSQYSDGGKVCVAFIQKWELRDQGADRTAAEAAVVGARYVVDVVDRYKTPSGVANRLGLKYGQGRNLVDRAGSLRDWLQAASGGGGDPDG